MALKNNRTYWTFISGGFAFVELLLFAIIVAKVFPYFGMDIIVEHSINLGDFLIIGFAIWILINQLVQNMLDDEIKEKEQ